MTGGPKCRAGLTSKSLPKYQSPWCLNSTDKNEHLCVSPKELVILFFIWCLGIVFCYFGVQDLYEGMQKKKKKRYFFHILFAIMPSLSCLSSGLKILKVWNIDFVAFLFIVYYHKPKTSGFTSGIHLGPIEEKNKE